MLSVMNMFIAFSLLLVSSLWMLMSTSYPGSMAFSCLENDVNTYMHQHIYFTLTLKNFTKFEETAST